MTLYDDMVKGAKRDYLTKKSTGYYTGCGCSQKATDLVVPPINSIEAWIPEGGDHIGPATGIKYTIIPNTTAIDVDRADYEIWAKDGVAHPARPGFKGIVTRNGT